MTTSRTHHNVRRWLVALSALPMLVAGGAGTTFATDSPTATAGAETGGVEAPTALCMMGTLSPTGTEPCLPAPAGTYVDVVGATAATPCQPGTFNPTIGAVQCLVAPIGTYVDVAGAVAPTPCPDGTTTSFVGAASADSCAPLVIDSDGDGVPDSDDVCPASDVQAPAPAKLKDRRLWSSADGTFVNGAGEVSAITVADTGGCTASQIVAAAGLGNGHARFGLSIGALAEWVSSV